MEFEWKIFQGFTTLKILVENQNMMAVTQCELGQVAHAGREGRINVLPWYRPIGVVSTSSETQGGKTGLPAKVSGRHVVRG